MHGFNLGPFFIQKQRLIIPQILLFTWPWEKDHNTRLGCLLDSRPSKTIHPHIPASQDVWLKCVPLGHKTAQNTVSETCHLPVRGADLKCQPYKSKLLFPYISKAYRCLRGTDTSLWLTRLCTTDHWSPGSGSFLYLVGLRRPHSPQPPLFPFCPSGCLCSLTPGLQVCHCVCLGLFHGLAEEWLDSAILGLFTCPFLFKGFSDPHDCRREHTPSPHPWVSFTSTAVFSPWCLCTMRSLVAYFPVGVLSLYFPLECKLCRTGILCINHLL